jgi:hypothetical protein
MEISKLVRELQLAFPQFEFIPAERACWAPKTKQVHYDSLSDDQASIWSLLHELGHAILSHESYSTDVDLLQKEVAAWDKACATAYKFGVSIDETYAQNCLETYRNWLYKRSTCTECGAHGMQNEDRQYYCLNCSAQWSVSTSRFCRPYRGKAGRETQTKSQEDSSWLFVGNAS